MGKAARQDHRQAQRAARQEASRRAERRRRRRPFFIAAAGFTLVALVATLVLVGSSSSSNSGKTNAMNQPPRGTRVFAETNHQHVTGSVTYDRVPPAGGAHSAVWLNCGIYSQPVPNENVVHSIEHGTVWITYRPDLAPDDVASLQRFVAAHYQGTQRYLVLSPYPGLPAPVVVSTWGAQLRLTGASDQRLATFVAHYAGGGQGGEKGAECTGGTGTPA